MVVPLWHWDKNYISCYSLKCLAANKGVKASPEESIDWSCSIFFLVTKCWKVGGNTKGKLYEKERQDIFSWHIGFLFCFCIFVYVTILYFLHILPYTSLPSSSHLDSALFDANTVSNNDWGVGKAGSLRLKQWVAQIKGNAGIMRDNRERGHSGTIHLVFEWSTSN